MTCEIFHWLHVALRCMLQQAQLQVNLFKYKIYGKIKKIVVQLNVALWWCAQDCENYKSLFMNKIYEYILLA